jgi:hypothetical protein
LILHVPPLSFVGPKILLRTFLSNTINLFLYGLVKNNGTDKFMWASMLLPVLNVPLVWPFSSCILCLLPCEILRRTVVSIGNRYWLWWLKDLRPSWVSLITLKCGYLRPGSRPCPLIQGIHRRAIV